MNPLQKLQWSVVLALCLLPMLLFAWLGWYTRPMSDDFCHFAITPHLSIWDNLLHWRNGEFNGSYSNMAMNSLLTPFGPHVTRTFPALLISLWFVVTAVLLSNLMARLDLVRHRLIITLALSALLVASASDSINTPASLYWYTASLKYTTPMLVLTLYLLLLLRVMNHPQGHFASWITTMTGAILCFFAAGFAETLTMPTLLGLTLLIGTMMAKGGQLSRRCLPVLIVGWIATVASMVVMITAPALTQRAESIIEHPVVASRSMQHTLSLAGKAWRDHITDPTALASFVFMLAAGLLVSFVYSRPPKTQARSLGQVERNPLLFGLAVQLMMIPILWTHQSDQPHVLGRFSGGYFLVTALNAMLLLSLAFMLTRRRQFDGWLENRSHVVPLALMFVILLCFALMQFRSIHWRANTYLWANVHSLLVILAWLLSSYLPPRRAQMARCFAVGIGSLYTIAMLGTAAVALAVFFHSKEDILRAYTFLAHLIAWSGLAWGVFLGYVLNASSGKHKQLTGGALVVALWLGCTIVVDNLAMLPKFQQYAREHDARHAYILEYRQAGQRRFLFAPLSIDLPRIMSVAPLDTHPCPLQYYDIDSIELTSP